MVYVRPGMLTMVSHCGWTTFRYVSPEANHTVSQLDHVEPDAFCFVL